MALLSASSFGIFLMRIGATVRFRITSMLLNKLNCWNTMPIFCRCRSMFLFWRLSQMSVPSKMILPEVGFSSKFRQRRNVDLPPPEGPMMETTSFL